MRRNKLKWTAICTFVLLALAAALFWIVWLNNQKADESDIRKDTRILTESFPTKVIVLGDEFPVLPKGVNAEYIDHISGRAVDLSGTEYEYVMLIINDIQGSVTLTDEDYETIRQLLKQEKLFFSYLGKSKLMEFQKRGFHQLDSPIDDDGNRSFTFFGGRELMGVYSSDYDEVKGYGLSDGSLFEGIQSAMVYMLEDREQEAKGRFR